VTLHALPAGYKFDLRHRQRIQAATLTALDGGAIASS
jgi:hypothetical protein